MESWDEAGLGSRRGDGRISVGAQHKSVPGMKSGSCLPTPGYPTQGAQQPHGNAQLNPTALETFGSLWTLGTWSRAKRHPAEQLHWCSQCEFPGSKAPSQRPEQGQALQSFHPQPRLHVSHLHTSTAPWTGSQHPPGHTLSPSIPTCPHHPIHPSPTTS